MSRIEVKETGTLNADQKRIKMNNKKSQQEKQSPVKDDQYLVPPDGNYGWIIVISYAIANFVGIPTTSNFGLIFKDKFDQMKMPAADLTLIININSALSMSLGLINGPLLRHFGYRKISVIAALLFSMGLMLTALTDSILGFIISYGVITAIGYGLSNSSFALALNSFFKNNLNKASGVAMTLAGIGPIIYPPLINYLLHIYDVDGCMLIIGAIALHMLVAAVLLQPLKWHMIKDTSYYIPRSDSVYMPTIIPNVSTYLSIGKFSESSFAPNSTLRLPFASNELCPERKSSMLEVSHDIDTQSIYGFDQIIHRQPSNNRIDQATIARNFSKRTLCSIPQNVELGFDSTEHQPPNGKPLRWFESGSLGSIHLGSSMENFKDPVTNSLKINRRESATSKPLWMQVVRKPSQARRLSQYVAEQDNDFRSKLSMPDKFGSMVEIEEIPTPMTSTNEERSSCVCNAFRWLEQFFDLDLLRDKIYLNIMIGMSISIFAEINFAILTPFILSDLKFDSDAIADILLVMAIADLISRFCSPFIADRLDLSIRMCYLISLVLLVATRMLMMFSTDYRNMMLVCTALGVGKGIRSVYMSIVVPSYIPIERLASASAIQLFANGIAMMCIGPILGLIKDITGSYVGCIIFLNICTLITITMYSIEMAIRWYAEKCSTAQDIQNS